MVRITECARERELYRYFQPEQDINHGAIDAPHVVQTPRSSCDRSITAFAQLGALRLNAKRASISLVGRNTEYILAEAGRSLSLQDDSRHGLDDALWHGVGTLESKVTIGSVVMEALANTPSDSETYLIVNDLTQDDRFTKLPCVVEAPFARFLACFPLTTQSGCMIGLYTIVDDEPRNGLPSEEISFLTDMATTVMDLIASWRVRACHHRSERMIKALGLYLEGGQSIREWWITQGQQGQSIQQAHIKSELRRGVTFAGLADSEFGVQEHGAAPDLRNDSLAEMSSDDGGASLEPRDGRPALPPNSPVDSVSVSESIDYMTTQDKSSRTSPNTSLNQDAKHTRKASIDSTATQGHGVGGKKLQEALLSDDLRRSFGRASNLIREGMAVEGVVFFDASIGSFAAASEKSNMNERAPGAHVVNGKDATTTTTSSDSDVRIDATSNENRYVIEDTNEACASVLGYSTRTRSSLTSYRSATEQYRCSEELLRRMSKRYPHGKVIDLTEDGSMSSAETEISTSAAPQSGPDAESAARKTEPKSKKRRSKEAEAKALKALFPEALSVAWFPLWDTSLERWYAAAMVWSSKPTRILDPEEDLTYLAAFSNSIMAEVSRMTTAVTSQLKVDFVSSISHELRSPLHGILASVEFLHEDGQLTSIQETNINTIQACGSMLLETIDHVLDFAKINKTLKAKKSSVGRRRSRNAKSHSRGRQGASSPAPEEANLRSATEEVVESIFAARFVNMGEPRASITTAYPAVPMVIVEMKPCDNWIFQIEGGAWRRIVMNIFSNSLKYTQSGFVHLSLCIDSRTDAKSRLELRIRDSGKGISREFLNTHLYTAFKQEDSLQSGTGLGLNIVRQMILDLGGSINLTSEAGSGTEAVVSLPLQPAKRKGLVQDPYAELRALTRDSKISILNFGFDILPDISGEATGIMTSEAEAMLLLKTSIRSMLSEWFEMDVRSTSEDDFASADVVITMTSGDVDSRIRNFDQNYAGSVRPAIIVVRMPFTRHNNYILEHGVQVVNVVLPVTVQKLATALSQVQRFKGNLRTTSGTKTINSSPASKTGLTPVPMEDEEDTDYFARPIDQPDSSTPPVSPGIRRLKKSLTSPTIQRRRSTTLVSATSSKSVPGSTKSNLSSPSTPSIYPPLDVLLVEDNAINLKLLVNCVNRLSCRYESAIHGLEAVKAYQQKNAAGQHATESPSTSDTARPVFDVVFMDLQMPVMDGLAATREIRAYERNHGKEHAGAATIIALTAATSAASRQEAYSSGVDLFLSKPVPMKVLRSVLEEYRKVGREGLRGREDWKV